MPHMPSAAALMQPRLTKESHRISPQCCAILGRRTTKELLSYHEEVKQNQVKVDEVRASDDDSRLKQWVRHYFAHFAPSARWEHTD